MDYDITFTSAEYETAWIEDLIFGILKKWPVEVFGAKMPWDIIITQQPFIREFEIKEAHDILFELRSKRTVPKQPLFPKDSLESEINFKAFVDHPPLKIMIFGDEQPAFLEIGENLSQRFGKYHITPETLVSREIKRRTQIGKWLNWNVSKGKGVPICVVTKLLEAELKRNKYDNRGFILSGFPIIPDLNANMECPCEFRDDESYEIQHESYYEQFKNFIGEEGNEEADSISVCSSLSSLSSSCAGQEDILNSIRNQKFVIEDGDEAVILQECVRKQLDFVYNLWCRPDCLAFVGNNSYSEQFTTIIKVLERFVLFYSSQNVFRLDIRIGVKAIVDCICKRFEYLYYKLNYEPIRMNTYESNVMSLNELCDTEKVLPHCPWWISHFHRICPVNLHYGRRRFCDNRFPVRYLKYIFLCHSADDRNKFVANPKKYMNLKTTCRAAVIGPHRTGKTTLSEYLAHYFKADIYRYHIEKSESTITDESTKEFKTLDTQRLKNFDAFKKEKTQEWTSCVLSTINEILAEVCGQKTFDLFSIKNAENYFQTNRKRLVPDIGIKQLLLEKSIFNQSIRNISPNDFIEWSSSQPHLHRQYVLDSAPLDINFWQELLINDALPDCVFLLRIASIKKMVDIYSLMHDATCIDHQLIYKKLCENFKHWKNLFEPKRQVNRVDQMRMNDSINEYIKYLVALRYKEASSFSKEYEELQLFLQDHDVICIEIDISQQSWTQTILTALIKHLSVFEIKAKALHDNRLQSHSITGYLGNEEGALSMSSSFYNEYADKERGSSSDISITRSIHFGYCRDWCPVLLRDNNILFKGHMRFAAKYKNKLYAMHSENALGKFISNPLDYSRSKRFIPPPRIYVAGLPHRTKLKMAEQMANALNVQWVTYSRYSSLFNGEFSIKTARDSYFKHKAHIIQDITEVYAEGAVIFGYPLLLEQFDDLIAHDLFPEYVIMFDDYQEVLNSIYRYYEKLSAQQYHATRRSSPEIPPLDTRFSISSDLATLPHSMKAAIMEKCKLILQPFVLEGQRLEDTCMKLRIPLIKVPKNYKRIGLADFYVSQINQHRKREAIFEDVQEITMSESEILLGAGYYRFSRFKRSCPVDVTRLITLNHFEGMRQQGHIYPCIYRDFIYFICGKNNLKDFKKDPLEFVNTCNPPQMQDPMRIAVFGHSKSGVTTVCRALAHELGYKIFSPNDFPDKPITDLAVIDLFKMHRSITSNGIVLDNIPLTPSLLLASAKNTVDITNVFIVVTSFRRLLEIWYNHRQNTKYCPSLSLARLHEKFCKTQESIKCIRKCVATSLLNIHYLNGDENSWTLWEKIHNELIKTTRSVQGYRLKLLKDRPASLVNLNLFYDIVVFRREINRYYCQVCLQAGKLKAFKYYFINVGPEFYSAECQKLLNRKYGYLNDEIYKKFNFSQPFEVNELMEPLASQRKFFMSLFQYKDLFFWCCDSHTIDFMTSSQLFYEESSKIKPKYIPFLVIGYTKEFIAFQGFCPVEYSRGKRLKGAMNLAVYYRKKVYLLANKENAIEFLSYPEKYRSLIFDPSLYLDSPNVTFHGLPQDTISNILLDLSYARPKHYSLTGTQSASTFVALKLKSTTASDKHEYWNTALRSFVKESKTLAIELKRHQNQINPYILFE